MCRERQRGERYYLKITHVGGAISRTILLAPPIPEGCPEGLLHSPLETYKTLNRHISHGQFIIPFLRVSSTTARLNPLSHPTRRSSLINCSPRFFFLPSPSTDISVWWEFPGSGTIDMQNRGRTPIFILSHASRAIEKFAWIDYRAGPRLLYGQRIVLRSYPFETRISSFFLFIFFFLVSKPIPAISFFSLCFFFFFNFLICIVREKRSSRFILFFSLSRF